MATSPVTFVQPLPFRTSRVRIARSPAICRASVSPSSPEHEAQFGDDDSQQKRLTRPFLPRLIRPARIPSAVLATAGALLGAAFTTGMQFVPIGPRPTLAAPATPAATQTKKQLRYDGRQELDSHEKAMSLTLTAGTFAALGVWAWKQNRRDDELETIRIRDEVDRLEKLQAEFVDVEEDDESLDDEDLLASLKQRISEGEDEEGGESGGEAPPAVGDGEDSPVDGVVEETDTSAADNATPDSVDMLRRMWDATDEDTKA